MTRWVRPIGEAQWSLPNKLTHENPTVPPGNQAFSSIFNLHCICGSFFYWFFEYWSENRYRGLFGGGAHTPIFLTEYIMDNDTALIILSFALLRWLQLPRTVNTSITTSMGYQEASGITVRVLMTCNVNMDGNMGTWEDLLSRQRAPLVIRKNTSNAPTWKSSVD